MMKYEKLKSSDLVEESFGTKPYLSVHQARIIFKKRVSMMQHVKMKYMSDMNYMKSMYYFVYINFAGVAPCFRLSGEPWLSLPICRNFCLSRDSPAGKLDKNQTKLFFL